MFKNLNRLLLATIVIFVLGDLLRKFALYTELSFVRYTAISKFIVLFLYLIIILNYFNYYYKNEITRKISGLIAVFFCSYIIGQLSLKNTLDIFNIYNKNILILFRYLFWPFTILVFWPLLANADSFKKEHLKLVNTLFFINVIIIFISFLFNIEFFRTYNNPDRFGFMGFFNTHNQASYYFIIIILYHYYQGIFNQQVVLKNIWVLLFYIATALLIGTKKIYLFLLMLGLFHVYHKQCWKSKKFYILFTVFVTLCVLGFEQIKAVFFSKFRDFVNIYNSKGLLSSLTSFRSDLLIETYNNTVKLNWTGLNYIFGGPRFFESRVEFGIIDLYLFFGLLGLFGFYFLFKYLYELTNYNKYYIFFLSVLILLDVLASGFLSSANQPILFIIITAFFIQEQNIKNITSVSG